jgi:hypothetical protein
MPLTPERTLAEWQDFGLHVESGDGIAGIDDWQSRHVRDAAAAFNAIVRRAVLWKPFPDMLPGGAGQYLVIVQCQRAHVEIAAYDPARFPGAVHFRGWDMGYVTHWADLPELPACP